ncbi:MAG: 23S rRNA (adenine(2030)-N(6))-methyltransferase RlmJ [Rubellimicrobium sp.]|nr:23S rRNA (adenine(2030)-N(6))-methyltransferase RlmJ [Rubellimicrobium sp.]
MLSYQHAYHAGNLADVHKHAVLSSCLDYMTRKNKPLSYLETHAGRGLYDLSGVESQRTGEAAAGILRLRDLFAADHPYMRAQRAVQARHGAAAYGGSPLIAAALLREGDRIDLAELHPQEHAALVAAMADAVPAVHVHRRDGAAMALALAPPEPRRGLALIDPSWELKEDYARIPDLVRKLHRKWNVGVLLLWYPILRDGPHRAMVDGLVAVIPEGVVHEVAFAPAREGHRMEGSGLFIVNPPWGIADELALLSARFAALTRQ